MEAPLSTTNVHVPHGNARYGLTSFISGSIGASMLSLVPGATSTVLALCANAALDGEGQAPVSNLQRRCWTAVCVYRVSQSG